MVNNHMNYKRIYDELIDRARSRSLEGYKEQHHIVPRCMGGGDESANLVYLTPEEHYVAHQLLVKMYPKNVALVNAALMMSVGGRAHLRSNKLYGWLKRRHVEECKKRVGDKNPSYGRRWYHDPVTGENGKFADGEIPESWIKGRVKVITLFCKVCKITEVKHSDTCNRCANQTNASIFIEENVDRLVEHFKETGSITRTLEYFGFSGRQGNKKLSKILKERGFDVLRRRNSPR
jgi:hypothetical protein